MRRSIISQLAVSLIFVLYIFGCTVSKPDVSQNYNTKPDKTISPSLMDSILRDVELSSKKVYKGERTQKFKLIHTSLKVSFDWNKQYLFGEAMITLRPYFYDQSELSLDAKGFEIHQVAMSDQGKLQDLKYVYNDSILTIDLGKEYSRDEKLNVFIKYTAKPNELATHGGKAISSDKGLYFINPTGEESDKPRQIWTQGETESNSRWFPTIDAPNQRCTQEMYITVNDGFVTLSNGDLISSQSNPDGTRTDYWKMDKPHAPYLFMMAIGDYAVVEDKWKDVPLTYYVEPKYKDYAKDIFGNTPEMITYYSQLLNYPFPWSKYAQVAVRDFVSGAMENTTATVFMENVQSDRRGLIDSNWDDIICHELFHQWFGDLITCESWANVTLNEAFATYGEYLWISHKYGQDEGDYHLYEDLQKYMEEAKYKREDLIRFHYDKDDDLFDNHSYAKGGLILHMLRNYIGDEAFFKSLEYYLKQHEYSDVEVHDFRLAVEKVVGEDMNWFFNQWFLAAGHPEITAESNYNPTKGTLTLRLKQNQDLKKFPLFENHLAIDVWVDGIKQRHDIVFDTESENFEFGVSSKPDLVLVNSDFNLLCQLEYEKKSPEEYYFQYKNYEQLRPRLDAFEYFSKQPLDSLGRKVISEAINDKFWIIRFDALEMLEKDTTALTDQLEKKVLMLADKDEKSLVRASALSVLSSKDKDKYTSLMKDALNDSSYSVVGVALYSYVQSDAVDKKEVIAEFKDYDNFNIVSTVADYYINTADYGQYDWFVSKVNSLSGGDLWYTIKLFGLYLVEAPDEIVTKGIVKLEDIARTNPVFHMRLAAYQSLELLKEKEGVAETLKDIREKERDQRLLQYIDN